MDSLITAAARALAAGDPLGALKRVALRDDARARALRGIAMAQLGDLVRAKALLRRAAPAFRAEEAVARARCVVAEAEILASRDLGGVQRRSTRRGRPSKSTATGSTPRMRDTWRLGASSSLVASTTPSVRSPGSTHAPPSRVQAVHQLVVAGIAMRRPPDEGARAALAQGQARGARRAHPRPDGGGGERRPHLAHPQRA
jgi:hypothetical protein